jgi:hypothetical protein
VKAIIKRLRRLEDQFGLADRQPRQYLRIVVERLGRTQRSEHATCRRTLWPDGTLFEMVHFGRDELTNEDLDRWIATLPIETEATAPRHFA